MPASRENLKPTLNPVWRLPARGAADVQEDLSVVHTGGAGPSESSKTSKTSAKHTRPQPSPLPGRPPEGPAGGARGARIFLSLFSLKRASFLFFRRKEAQ